MKSNSELYDTANNQIYTRDIPHYHSQMQRCNHVLKVNYPDTNCFTKKEKQALLNRIF